MSRQSSRREIKRILLLFPPIVEHSTSLKPCLPPLGISYLGAFLRKDYEVALLDTFVEGFFTEVPLDRRFSRTGLRYEEIDERIARFRPDLLGITCLFSTHFPIIRELCRKAKRLDPGLVTATGGAHPTFLARECMAEAPELDFIALGEGEPAISALLKALETGADLAGVDGIAYRENGEVRVSDGHHYIQDLDALPFPAFALLPLPKYERINIQCNQTSRNKKNLPVITSRGCTARCTFCSSAQFWGRRNRPRSAENVLEEVASRVDRYGTREIQFLDDNITLQPDRAKAIFQGMIDRNLRLEWSTPNGVALWTLDEEMVRLMKASGCYELVLAIESGSQEVLSSIIRKPLLQRKVEEAVRVIKSCGIQTHSFFIVGFPGETKEQIRQTFSFPRKLDLDRAVFFIFTPQPGTELTETCRREGLIPPDFGFGDLSYAWSVFQSDEFSSAELERWVASENLRFNFRLLFRHPLAFLSRYLSIPLRHPLLTLRVLKNSLFKIRRDRAPRRTVSTF